MKSKKKNFMKSSKKKKKGGSRCWNKPENNEPKKIEITLKYICLSRHRHAFRSSLEIKRYVDSHKTIKEELLQRDLRNKVGKALRWPSMMDLHWLRNFEEIYQIRYNSQTIDINKTFDEVMAFNPPPVLYI